MRSVRRAFGLRVQKLRHQRGWSQDEFAHRSGLHRTYVGGIERGERNPTLESMFRLARALGTSLSALMQGVGDGSE